MHCPYSLLRGYTHVMEQKIRVRLDLPVVEHLDFVPPGSHRRRVTAIAAALIEYDQTLFALFF
jgi:hypothetical protein